MPQFDEWQVAPNGTAPESAFVPPGNGLAEQTRYCVDHADDPTVGVRCIQWLREKGLI